MDFDAYLERLASDAPTPGGGSAATIVGALGTALIAMVARLTLGSDNYAALRAEAQAIAVDADRLQARFLAARPVDEAAFAAVIAAQSLPRDTETAREARRERLQAALTGAAEAPLAMCELCVEAFALASRARALNNKHLESDVTCAYAFARATLEASAASVRVNHHYMTDAAVIAEQTQRLNAALATASAHADAPIAGLT